MSHWMYLRHQATSTGVLAIVMLACVACCALCTLAQAAAADAAIVRTPEELVHAVALGVPHIMLVDHIDLSGPAGLSSGGPCTYTKLCLVYATTSIQVRSCLWLHSCHFVHHRSRSRVLQGTHGLWLSRDLTCDIRCFCSLDFLVVVDVVPILSISRYTKRDRISIRWKSISGNPQHGVHFWTASPYVRCNFSQGNCSESSPPPTYSAPDLLQLKPGQCVLSADQSFLTVHSTSGVDNLYLNNLYLRAAGPTTESDGDSYMMELLPATSALWCKDVTFQGTYMDGIGDFWGGMFVTHTPLNCDGATSKSPLQSQLTCRLSSQTLCELQQCAAACGSPQTRVQARFKRPDVGKEGKGWKFW
jgi:hypothetical protein